MILGTGRPFVNRNLKTPITRTGENLLFEVSTRVQTLVERGRRGAVIHTSNVQPWIPANHSGNDGLVMWE